MIERRSFLAMSATGVALAAVEAGCSAAGPGVSAAVPSGASAPPHADLEEATVTDLAVRMQRGEVTL